MVWRRMCVNIIIINDDDNNNDDDDDGGGGGDGVLYGNDRNIDEVYKL